MPPIVFFDSLAPKAFNFKDIAGELETGYSLAFTGDAYLTV
jgi:hypothetical protein